MATQLVRPGQGPNTIALLVLNPNSSKVMSDAMVATVKSLDLHPALEIHIYTAPDKSPPSIDDDDTLKRSTEAVSRDLLASPSQLAPKFDGVLVACFSSHPLTPLLRQYIPTYQSPTVSPHLLQAITGIFEASVTLSLALLLHQTDKFGIVTTGAFWEAHLSDAVHALLGAADSARFAGVCTTGLNAGDFHNVDPSVVEAKLKDATKKLMQKGDVTVVVMGCAGMAGLEELIREAVSEVKGREFAYGVLHVVDAVKAGVWGLEMMARQGRLRSGV